MQRISMIIPLRGWLLLLVLALFLLAANFIVINKLRRRKGQAGKRASNAKKMIRLIVLLLAEALTLLLGYFSLAYMVSLNSTLMLEGDTDAIREFWDAAAPENGSGYTLEQIVRYQGNCLSVFPNGAGDFDCGTIQTQAALFNLNWELQESYDNLNVSNELALKPEQLLEKAKKTGEKTIPTTTWKLPWPVSKLIVFISQADPQKVAAACRIQALPLHGRLSNLFQQEAHEYCGRMVLVERNDGEDSWYAPLAFGEEQISALDRTSYHGESDVYYFYSRSYFSRYLVALVAMNLFRSVFWGIPSFVLLLIVSIIIQSMFSAKQERKLLQQQRDLLVSVAHELKTPMGTSTRRKSGAPTIRSRPGETRRFCRGRSPAWESA